MRLRRLFLSLLLFVSAMGARSEAHLFCPRDSVKVVTGGIHLDLNYSGYAISHLAIMEDQLKMGPGASLGGFVFFDIHRYFAMQFDWILHLKTSRVQAGGKPGNLVFAGSEFPLTLMVQWQMPGCHRMYFGLGPSTFVGYYASLWTSDGMRYDLYEKSNPEQEVILHYVSMGFGFNLGFEFNFGLQINASYKLGCYNMTDANRTPVRAYPHTVMVGVGYRFGLEDRKGVRHAK